jgi:hypothetical protein|tara:strand:- start:290 stop:496 length:207 start_codon:yes stop_codon:yes gene_type:complete
MKTFKVTYIETIVREVSIKAPVEMDVQKRFNEGNFPFTEGKEVNADIHIHSIREKEEINYDFSEGDPL